MELQELEADQATIVLTKRELYILRSIVSEIYAGVCVDSIEFETIHAVEKNEVLDLKKELSNAYKKFLV